MIATDSIRKLNTSVVYLSRDSESDPAGIGGLLLGAEPMGLSQIVDAPEIRQMPDGLMLSSMRNQLTININPNRLVLGDASGDEPARKDFPGRVARIAEYVGQQSNQTYIAVGLNFDIELVSDDDELPSKAMLDWHVKEEVLKGTGCDVVGASARLWYVARDRMHDLRIEPRGNQYDGRDYFVHLNVHIVLEGDLPSAEWISQALDEEYSHLIRVLTDIP